MRLVGQIYVTVPSQQVQRDPTFIEKVKRSLGGRVNLETDEVQNQLEATSVVDGVRRALARLGVGNALSLVIDDTVIFQDTDGKADDLPDLVLALSEHASVFGRGFRELKFAAEHEEAGLHLVIEARARTRHRKQDPAAVISVGGRIRQLEPQRGESAEAYRARVEPLTRDAALFETARLAFETFVTRLHDAISAAIPDAKVEERKAEARVVRTAPEGRAAASERVPREPTHPAYDPFIAYYPSPMATVLDAMLFASLMNMAMPPPILLVSPFGMPLGQMSDVQAHPELADVGAFDGAGDDGPHAGAGHGGGDDSDQSDHDSHALVGHEADVGADDGSGVDGSGGDWSDGGWDGGGWDGGGDGGGDFD
jgi:hypothetical protein